MQGIAERLEENPLRKELIHHPFFKEVKSLPLTREQVGVFLGQWWHPLHYFPNFLSRTIDQVPALEMKTAICKILNEELGEGNPANAPEEEAGHDCHDHAPRDVDLQDRPARPGPPSRQI